MDIVTFHLIFLFSAFPAVLYSDIQGLRWLLGGPTLKLQQFVWIHRYIYVCLLGIVTTGAFMFLQGSSYYLSLPAFIMKMVFVAALIANSFLIGAHMRYATQPFASLSTAQKRSLLISGALSGICWVGAIVGGLLIG